MPNTFTLTGGCSVVAFSGFIKSGVDYTLSGGSGSITLSFTSSSTLTGSGFGSVGALNAPAGFSPTTSIGGVTNITVAGAPTYHISLGGSTGAANTNSVSIPDDTSYQDLYLSYITITGTITLGGQSITLDTTGGAGGTITGDYVIASWYFNPNTNHYQLSATNPGSPWVLQGSAPSPTITSIVPSQGPATGSTNVTINGSGFGDGAGVIIGSAPATSVSVVNSNTITCTTAAFLGSLTGPTNLTIDGEDPTHSGITVTVNDATVNVQEMNVDGGNVTNNNAFIYYTVLPEWWTISIDGINPAPTGFLFGFNSYGNFPPPPLLLPFPFFFEGIFYENFTFSWVGLPSTPTNTGWWLEVANDYTGAALISNQGTPRDPRSFDEMSPFTATAAGTGMMGGFPSVASVWNNFLIYAKGGYTVGTNVPPLQIYDGQFDEQIGLLPATASNAVPNAIVTTLVADGQIFLASFDSGTDKNSWVGRVFSFEVETETFTQLGLPFATGELPYALAWHNGRLWCGTHRQDPTVQGSIYFFRPNVDTAWTKDIALTTGSCCSLLSYQGLLYAGTTAPSGTSATVLVRGTNNAWTTSDTGSGTAANNAYLALALYGTNMYASYWDSAGPTSKIRQFNGTSWSTVYTGSGDTNIPYVGFPTDDGNIIAAIGGGLTYAGALVTSPDGTTWTDRTAFLTQGATNATGIPAFGIISH